MDAKKKVSIEKSKNYRVALKIRKERALERTKKLSFIVQAYLVDNFRKKPSTTTTIKVAGNNHL